MSEHLSRKEKKHPDSRCSTKLEALSAWQHTADPAAAVHDV